MNFTDKIISLIDITQEAWNNGDIDSFESLFEEDIVASIAPVTISLIKVESMQIEGKQEALKFLKALRKKLPLKYEAEYNPEKISKHIHYSKFFYQIGLRAHFECIISEYGKYKEFHIRQYENAHSSKITTFQIMKNVVAYNVRSLLKKNK